MLKILPDSGLDALRFLRSSRLVFRSIMTLFLKFRKRVAQVDNVELADESGAKSARIISSALSIHHS